MVQNGAIMAVFLVLLIPLLLMVFALLMERLEHRLRMSTMSGHDVEEFLDKAKPDEVNAFIKEGWTGALASFRRRRGPRGKPRPTSSAHSRSAVAAGVEPTPGPAPHEGSA